MEKPTTGSVIIDGVDITSYSDNQLRQVRQSIGMIFQGFNLLMQRNALDNVCFPLELVGMSRKDAINRARELLKTVGLADKGKHIRKLSGGKNNVWQ